MLAFLFAGLMLAAAAPAAPSVDSLARSISKDDAARAVAAMYSPSASRHALRMIVRETARMPGDDPFVHYAGRTSDGTPEIWIAKDVQSLVPAWQPAGDKTEGPRSREAMITQAFNEAYGAALIHEAAESGLAGSEWKIRFASALDPELLARAIARAYTMQAEAGEAKARADIAWVHAHVVPAMARAEVYAALRGRGLKAYNDAYNPGKGDSQACNFAATRDAAAFPQPNQALPSGPCRYPMGQKPTGRDLAHPEVYIAYVVRSSLACGRWVYQYFTFDENDRLQSVRDTAERDVCL